MRRYHADVVGTGWYGQTIATSYTWDDSTILNGDSINEETLLNYFIDTHTGDFQTIRGTRIDAIERASCGHFHADRIVRDFDDEAAILYNDCMFGDEE